MELCFQRLLASSMVWHDLAEAPVFFMSHCKHCILQGSCSLRHSPGNQAEVASGIFSYRPAEPRPHPLQGLVESESPLISLSLTPTTSIWTQRPGHRLWAQGSKPGLLHTHPSFCIQMKYFNWKLDVCWVSLKHWSNQHTGLP